MGRRIAFGGFLMAWTELHDTLPEHPKIKMLMAELGCTKPHAIGILCALWCFTLKYGRAGTLDRGYFRGWAVDVGEKDPDGLLAALQASRWIHVDANTLSCHDWDDYAGRLEEIRRRDREKKRRLRDVGGLSRAIPDLSPGDSPGESDRPNQTKPNQTKPTRPRKRGVSGSEVQIPDDLQVHEADIRQWFDYRLKRKPPIYDVSLQAHFDELRELGAGLPGAIRKSIANGWQGLFAPKGNGKPTFKFASAAADAERYRNMK